MRFPFSLIILFTRTLGATTNNFLYILSRELSLKEEKLITFTYFSYTFITTLVFNLSTIGVPTTTPLPVTITIKVEKTRPTTLVLESVIT